MATFSWVVSSAAAVPPVIQSQSVSGLTETNAILEATIVPGYDEAWGGTEAGGAWYQFQLVAEPSEYWPEVTCPTDDSDPEISCRGPYGPPNWEEPLASIVRRADDLPTERLLGSLEAKAVALDLSSIGVTLEPGRTYHYRVIAAEAKQTTDQIKWHTPPVYGPDQTFTTPAPPEALPSGSEIHPPMILPPPPPADTGPVPPRTSRARCSLRSKPKAKLRFGIQCRRAVALARAK